RGRGDLQVADELLSLERQFHDLERRQKILCGLAEGAQRMPVRLLLARRAGDRVAADAAIVERQRIELGEFLAVGARLEALVALGLVGEPDLAPQLRPLVAVEAGQRIHHLLGILAADALERIDAPGAPHHLLLDLVERALLGAGGRYCGQRQRGRDGAYEQLLRDHLKAPQMAKSATHPVARNAHGPWPKDSMNNAARSPAKI